MPTITCPECGKELQVNDPSRSFIFCRHCGTKIAVSAFLESPQPSPETVSQSDDVSIEELRHQHELELEQLRHEHELELERLRHKNELDEERPSKRNSSSAKKADQDAELKNSFGYRFGHFCRNYPILAIIFIMLVIGMLFGPFMS